MCENFLLRSATVIPIPGARVNVKYFRKNNAKYRLKYLNSTAGTPLWRGSGSRKFVNKNIFM